MHFSPYVTDGDSVMFYIVDSFWSWIRITELIQIQVPTSETVCHDVTL